MDHRVTFHLKGTTYNLKSKGISSEKCWSHTRMACESEPLFFPAQKLFYRIFPREVNVFPERSVRATQRLCAHSSHLTTRFSQLATNRSQNSFCVEVNQPSCGFTAVLVDSAKNWFLKPSQNFSPQEQRISRSRNLKTPHQASLYAETIDFDGWIIRNCANWYAVWFLTTGNAFLKALNSRKSLRLTRAILSHAVELPETRRIRNRRRLS